MNWKTVTKSKKSGGLGIHTARETNVALLGKHVWSLIHNPSKLWVRLLRSKYLKSHYILDIDAHQRGSYIWISISNASSYLANGFKYRIGKGDVSIWFDKWLDDDYVCQLIPFANI